MSQHKTDQDPHHRAERRQIAVRALASCDVTSMPRVELASVVAAADASGLLTYGEIADLIGVPWLEVAYLVLDAPHHGAVARPQRRAPRRGVAPRVAIRASLAV